MLTLIFLPKRALKEVWKGPSKMKQKQHKKTMKTRNCAGPDTARPCRGAKRTGGRAHAHGWPCTHARPCITQARPCTGLRQIWPLLPGVHGRAPLWHARTYPVFYYFAILDAWGFLKHLILLEIAREVFFSIKT